MEKRSAIEPDTPALSIEKQCNLIRLARSTFYFHPSMESPFNLQLMRLIDEEYTRHPFYGSRKMTAWLRSKGHLVNRKRVQRLLRLMGLEAIYQKPRTSQGNPEHKKYPYLLRGMTIDAPNLVWSTDITYIRLREGFVYLSAVIDWYSRYVLSWKISNTLDSIFCVEALEEALERGKPEIFNTDQGVQFTSNSFTNVLTNNEIKISMDGKGRYLDNIFIERLWRSVKYECIYLREFESVQELHQGLSEYFEFYNNERLHQALDYAVPASTYTKKLKNISIG